MKLLLRNIIFLLTSLNLGAQGSPATSPYFLYEPNFQNLIPFTKDQLERIKDQGIVRLEETWIYNVDTSTKTTYHFNNFGQLTHQRTLDQFMDSSVVVDSTHYVYDNKSRLILRKMNGGLHSSFDSLAYDSTSQVIYYDSSYDLKLEDTTEHEVLFKLRPKVITGDTVILVDLFDPEYPTEYHFDENTLVKVKDSYRTDSIVISAEQRGEWEKTYWFKNHRVSDFRIGKIAIFKDSLLRSTSIFEMYNQDHLDESIEYYYSPEKNLIRIQKSNEQIFIIYGSRGLITSHIRKRGKNLELTDLKYYYR